MKTYYLVDWTNIIVARCQARDNAHATEKFQAFGHSFNAASVMSAAEYRDEKALIKEQMGI